MVIGGTEVSFSNSTVAAAHPRRSPLSPARTGSRQRLASNLANRRGADFAKRMRSRIELATMATALVLALGCAAAHAALPPSGGDTGQSALYGTHEVYNADTGQFPQWTDAMARAQSELGQTRVCAGAESSACTPREWRNLIDGLSGLPLMDKLARVNDAINSHPYVPTQINWGRSMYWEAPFEFLAKGGQCQDYAITKYLALREAGVPDQDLRVLVLHDTQINADHAVLVANVDGVNYLLDNLNPRILPASQVTAYRPYYAINQSGMWFYFGGGAMVATTGGR